jgi:DUF4097 and DUF4098 domain-containing protein YvlB
MPMAGKGIQDKEHQSTHDFQPGGALNVKSSRGKVTLTTWDQNKIEVVARIGPPQEVSEDYARRAIEATRIEVAGSDRSLTIQANYDDVPYGDGKGDRSRTLPRVDLEIRAPRRLALNLHADMSEVKLQGIEGKIELDSDRGSVTGSELTGEIRLRIDRGDASLSGLNGKINVASDRGDVTLEAGHITGDSRLEVNRGSIKLKLPERHGLSFHARVNEIDNFHCDFPINVRTMKGKRIEGTINGGGPELFIKADRGKVSLKQQG